MAALTLALTFWYSPLLTYIALIAFALYGVVRFISFSFEREAIEAESLPAAKSNQC
jgi:ATP-binding cassette subfamily B protein RaxB